MRSAGWRRFGKQKKSENIGVRTHGTSTFRYPDGSTRKAHSPGASSQSTKIPDSVIRVSPHQALGIEVAHPAVFPVDLVSEILGTFSDAGDLAFEPFCGSGTQLIAAERDGRRCYAVEIAASYCDVAVKRWCKFTGRPAVLADDGRTFDEVAEARGVSP